MAVGIAVGVLAPTASAKPLKVKFTCSFTRDGTEVTLPTRGNPKIDGNVKCTVEFPNPKGLDHKKLLVTTYKVDGLEKHSAPFVTMTQGGQPGPVKEESYLLPNRDFIPCADFEVFADVQLADGSHWTKKLTFKQSCR